MEINYGIIIPVLIAVIALIVFLIRRNRKDEKKFEEEMISREIKPEKHENESI